MQHPNAMHYYKLIFIARTGTSIVGIGSSF